MADVTDETDLSKYTFVEKTGEIKYTDNVALIINMINSMIQIVTVALVAFTALSLVVSTVMVGIITYVSVVERIKEIGVIRSLGGRKKDVSNLFTAETLMIGFSSGVFGIFVTGVLCLLINAGANAGTDGAIKSICHLTIPTAVIMILLSMFLTFIAGIMPAKNAARRDPVQALRSE
jgi:putative ABC transport system permease protein